MPAVYGFIVALFATLFGSIAGDFVDTNPRMRVIWSSLFIQNGLVAITTVIFCLMFYYSWDVCNQVVVFACLMIVIILFGSVSKLATITNTISIEKDWVVVIADKNSVTLSVLNANMRRIDLSCKLLAPIVAGILLTHTQSLIPSLSPAMAGGFMATLIIGLWNVISFFGELSLLILVYRFVPALSTKNLRVKDQTNAVTKSLPLVRILKKLASPYIILTTGWKIFWRQEVNLVGFSLASLYLTVLGFSGITATYFLTQGLTSDYIGLAQGLGGLVGIAGTLLYPFLRRKVGTVRSGLFGITAQLLLLSFCVIGVFLPGAIDDEATNGYYSPNCNTSGFNMSIDPSAPDEEPTITVGASVILILIGVTGARFGLWMFDLSVWQLVQEKVVENERGVVSGVMNAMNSNMDMLHYVMAIAAPHPRDFRYLTVISFLSVFMGWVFYCLYVRRARGHLCHFNKLTNKCCTNCSIKGKPNREQQPQLTFVNSIAVEDDDDDNEL
jgi:iron-regulated transporter 1